MVVPLVAVRNNPSPELAWISAVLWSSRKEAVSGRLYHLWKNEVTLGKTPAGDRPSGRNYYNAGVVMAARFLVGAQMATPRTDELNPPPRLQMDTMSSPSPPSKMFHREPYDEIINYQSPVCSWGDSVTVFIPSPGVPALVQWAFRTPVELVSWTTATLEPVWVTA